MNFVVFVLEIAVLVFSTRLIFSAAEYEINGRIFNGQDANWTQAKYQAVIFVVRSKFLGLSQKELLCGGTIIGPNWVLTAAHCLLRIKKVTVALGVLDAFNAEVFYELQQHHIHYNPYYDDALTHNDIALIQIPKTEECAFVAYAKLPFRWINHPLPDTTVIASGFGNLNNAGDKPERLQCTRMGLIRNEECSLHFDDVAEEILCAATSSPYGSICCGDSGGPVLLEESGELVGVVSQVLDNCEAGKPAILMRVTSYLSWISEMTGIH